MTGSARLRPSFVVFSILLALLAATLHEVQGEADELDQELSEDKCRPYIEKALKNRETGTADEDEEREIDERDVNDDDSKIEIDGETPADEAEFREGEKEEDSVEQDGEVDKQDDVETVEDDGGDSMEKEEVTEGSQEVDTKEEDSKEKEQVEDQVEVERVEAESGENQSTEDVQKETEEETDTEEKNDETVEEKEGGESVEEAEGEGTANETAEDSIEDKNEVDDEATGEVETEGEGEEKNGTEEDGDNSVEVVADDKSVESEVNENEVEDVDKTEEKKDDESIEEANSEERKEETEEVEGGSQEKHESDEAKDDGEEKQDDNQDNSGEKGGEKSAEDETEVSSDVKEEVAVEESQEKGEDEEKGDGSQEKDETVEEETDGAEDEKSEETSAETTPEEELIQEIEIPENLRPREHINQILRLDEENEVKEAAIEKAAEIILKDLKKLYETAIKPLETLYKYRDLSNRHFGDPEIFSKPLVLFMGPWSGGKSSIINYLLDIEYKSTALRTGAEPSPAYFNILMHGQEEQVLDGTQLAADWTFSGLQKFGQGMLDRLRGLKLNNKLLEKVNIVEIPGILEIRKQIQRLFPFNDACQWFIDRADIIFLVYDPSKLDVGPETEAILDQLKGREYQTRIILNKADQVKPEELMRVQGALIWNISPLMSSAEPPIMYSTSLWSMPYEIGAPTRLLYAQERAFLRDLRSAVDKRVEHKIASARRFAVRVRNHAKMVDCYLTTYYNHKSFFGSKKEISDKIIENPQDYHIYEGLSTLTNISRYDLPDPDVYRDFFRLNSLYEFPLLSSTCTYFRGCPINRLDVAIAYDLPELVGKYKKAVETVINESKINEPQPS